MIDIFKVKTPSIEDLEKYSDSDNLPKISELEPSTKKPFYKRPLILAIIIITISMSVISMIISLFIY